LPETVRRRGLQGGGQRGSAPGARRGRRRSTRAHAGARGRAGSRLARTPAREGGALVIAAFTLLYTGIVLVLFKLKLVKPRPLPIAWTVVAGVLIIGGIVVAWSLGAPMSSRVVTSQYVIQLVPYVKGQVKQIHAVANQPVKQGDLLLEINPEPYQYKVDQVQGQLQAAQDNVKQAGAGLQAARANVVKSQAGVTQARA